MTLLPAAAPPAAAAGDEIEPVEEDTSQVSVGTLCNALRDELALYVGEKTDSLVNAMPPEDGDEMQRFGSDINIRMRDRIDELSTAITVEVRKLTKRNMMMQKMRLESFRRANEVKTQEVRCRSNPAAPTHHNLLVSIVRGGATNRANHSRLLTASS